MKLVSISGHERGRMKNKLTLTFLAFLVIIQGCASTGSKPVIDEDKIRKYSQVEILLSDFSKKITAYFEKQGLSIPKDFDEQRFLEVLRQTYPDQSKVDSIRENFKIKVRPLDTGYSVMLCDPATDNKIMEDFSCHLKNVEVRIWDKDGNYPCKFEDSWQGYCK
jgi:hypothetical protein